MRGLLTRRLLARGILTGRRLARGILTGRLLSGGLLTRRSILSDSSAVAAGKCSLGLSRDREATQQE